MTICRKILFKTCNADIVNLISTIRKSKRLKNNCLNRLMILSKCTRSMTDWSIINKFLIILQMNAKFKIFYMKWTSIWIEKINSYSLCSKIWTIWKKMLNMKIFQRKNTKILNFHFFPYFKLYIIMENSKNKCVMQRIRPNKWSQLSIFLRKNTMRKCLKNSLK